MSSNAPMILMYNLEGKKGSRLRLLCLKLRVRVRAVRPEEYALPVGVCADQLPLPETMPAPVDGFSDEMLVMVNFGSKLLNAFLSGIRAEGIPGVALKAVLTPTNQHWDSAELHRNLAAEHEAMRNARRSVHEEGRP